MEKNAIITGANRGIGRAAVEKFAQKGINIWACARQENKQFEEEMKELAQKYNVWIEPVYFDLSDENAIKLAVKGILQEKKSVDILVNNAGVPYGALLQMTPISKLREVYEINFFSQILLMQLVSRVMMKQRSGCIINMASAGGIETNPGYLAYGSSKAAIIWATQSIAKELGPYGIRVNAVAPGLTNTDMGHYKTEEEIEKVLGRTALRRMAEPKEIADSIWYLTTDEASYVTGQILRVDGGRI